MSEYATAQRKDGAYSNITPCPIEDLSNVVEMHRSEWIVAPVLDRGGFPVAMVKLDGSWVECQSVWPYALVDPLQRPAKKDAKENDITRNVELAHGKGPTDILEGTQQFMEAAGQLKPADIGFPAEWNDPLRKLRRRLVTSEFHEFLDGEALCDKVETADGLADVIVTAWGSLLAYFGPELARLIVAEVADSNLSKIWPDGSCIKDAGGKVSKDHEYYRAPQLAKIIEDWEYQHPKHVPLDLI